IGVYQEKQKSLEHFTPKPNSGIILLESVEKPGNLGAVLRSCEAFGIDAIIITDPKTDFYNPNVIRSSVGCLFGMNFFQTDNESAMDFFK
ncbi:TrmH family RNA methyltransferase, partial [Stenotrophomonas maltophilia]